MAAAGRLLVIERGGTFDVPAARAVARSLDGAAPDLRVRLDLSGVREFHDLGLAVLAQALLVRARPVELVGLRHHQARLLRYLGVDAAEPEGRGGADAEEPRPDRP